MPQTNGNYRIKKQAALLRVFESAPSAGQEKDWGGDLHQGLRLSYN